MISRNRSAPTAAAMSIECTTSAKRTVTCLYSADLVAGTRAVPHSLQNLAVVLDCAPHDPQNSPVAVSPPPPSPLGSTSVSFHRRSVMSVISPRHLRHEVSRPSDVVCFETDGKGGASPPRLYPSVRLRPGVSSPAALKALSTPWSTTCMRASGLRESRNAIARPHRDRGRQPRRVAASWWRFRLHGWVIQRSSGGQRLAASAPLTRRTPGGSPDVENTAQPRVRRLSTLLAMKKVAVGYRPSVAMVG